MFKKSHVSFKFVKDVKSERKNFKPERKIFSTVSYVLEELVHMVSGQNPHRQNPPGQNPPDKIPLDKIPPRTKSPQDKIPLDKIPPVYFIFY